MLGHLLQLALRNLWRYRATSAINLAALVLGLLCFALAAAFTTAIDKADSRWPNADRIAVITEQALSPGNGKQKIDATRVAPMTPRYLKTDYPDLPAVSALTYVTNASARNGEKSAPAEVQTTDETFTRIFAWPLRHGDWRTAFDRPDGAVLSRDVALALFGEADPVGKPITIAGHDLTVTGVIGDFPDQVTAFNNWHLILIAASAGEALLKEHGFPTEMWANRRAECFVLLPPGMSAGDLDGRLADFARRHVPADQGAFAFGAMRLAGLTDSMFRGIAGMPLSRLFLALGTLVLAVAALNYMNLAAGLAHGRLSEMALRRILGESARHIVLQILLECALLVLAALALTAGALILLIPVMAANRIGNVGLDFSLRLPIFWIRLGIGAIATIFAGGLYPALILARSPPREIAEGAQGGGHSRLLPSLLVGTQFLLGSLLLIGVLIIGDQASYLTRLIIPKGEDPLLITYNLPRDLSLATLREQSRAIPAVHAISATGSPLFNMLDVQPYRHLDEPASAGVPGASNWVNDDFFEAIGATFLAGHDSPEGDGKDGAPTADIVIDRSFARAQGWTPPQAIGQEIVSLDPKNTRTLRVIGVIADRPTAAYGEGARGALYQRSDLMMMNGVIRIAEPNSAATIDALNQLFRRVAPNETIIINRLSDSLRWNDQSQLFLQWLRGLAAFAFSIGIVGLAGMALHVTARRRHEVGVRKVLGAGTLSVMLLLMGDFARPVLLANLLAWPFAYIGEQAYLDLFTMRPRFSPEPFLIALAASLGIAALAVGWQAWRAARRDPATVLRHE